jgi:CHAT domain-containing protein
MATANAVLKALANSWSPENGRSILLDHVADLTEDVPQALLCEAARLRTEGDADGAAEYESWAGSARALLTRRDLLASPPSNPEDAEEILGSRAERYDDAFFDLSLWIAAQPLSNLQDAVSRVEKGDISAVAAARASANEAMIEEAALKAFARFARRADRLAEAQLSEGTRLLLVAQLERIIGDSAKSEQARQAAEAALKACAEAVGATPGTRARAESSLAALAGPDQPEIVAEHQLRAQRHAENANDPRLLRSVRRDRAWWARKRGDLETAFTLLQSNIDDGERAIWKTPSPIQARRRIEEILPDFRSIIEICLERGDSEPVWNERALEFSEQAKARPMLRAMALIAESAGPPPPRLQHRREILLTAIEREAAKLGANRDLKPVLEPRLDALQDALGEAEGKIDACTMRSRALDLQCAPLSFAEMVAVVPPGAAILSFYVLPERTIAFVLTAAGLLGPPVSIKIQERDLARLSVDLDLPIRLRADYTTCDALQRKLEEKLDFLWPYEAARALHNLLISPVADRLRGVTQLWISPHATLMRIPFHALEDSQGVLLGETMPIAYAPGIAVLSRCLRQRRPGRATLFAAGTDAGGNALRGTREETAAVARRFGCAPQQATIKAVLHDATRADIVHLACHSNRRSASTAFQGLVLEDGLLSQSRIAGAKFAASLVTLSACDVAGGDLVAKAGAEMFGIIGSFLRAGCPRVVATMWPADDRMAALLMDTFYAELRKPETSCASALAAAQKQVRQNSVEAFRHPYFWAPFCVWGDA